MRKKNSRRTYWMIAALVAGILLGAAAVVWRDRWVDRLLGILSVSVIAVPATLATAALT